MTRLGTLAASVALLGLASGAAFAQSAAPGTAPGTSLDATSGTLSEKLGDTGGVIKPSGDVDPAMHKPAPDAGSMPVIKPGAGTDGVAK